ncbi:hypothetical protein [Mycoplasmopsis mustelae]|uniref:hypothetical protein n=1 Tax=Mycoplasmopsis mustelae TaxID=171289 RepID=UPI001064AAEC|nr:hypothetical protein [Mycoplasmopsis mustelae]
MVDKFTLICKRLNFHTDKDFEILKTVIANAIEVMFYHLSTDKISKSLSVNARQRILDISVRLIHTLIVY